LIPLIANKDNQKVKFHTNQGLLLLIFGFAFSLVLSILGIIPYVGIVFRILSAIVGVVFLAGMIYGIVNAAQGQEKELPIIGKIRILK